MTHGISGKTALVAGGAGFIGSHLCAALLDRNYRVICVDSLLTGAFQNIRPLCAHANFRWIRHDVTQPLSVAEKVDEVFNLACAASPPQYQADPVHTMLTNVLGTRYLLALAGAKGARFVQASTSEVYGDPEEHPQREDYRGHVSCTGTRACYDEGKRAAEALCWDVVRSFGTDVRVARIFNTYGPHMRADDGRIISNFIVQALRRQPLTIYGSGDQTRSFCYVSDLVEGLLRLMQVTPAPDGAVNLGNPGEFTVRALAGMVARLVPGHSGTVYQPLPEDDPRRRCPDIGRARALLGWQPRVPLEEGLVLTAGWFAEQLAAREPRGVASTPPAAKRPAAATARLNGAARAG